MVDNQHRPILLCFSGKRRSGKDFVCNRLQKLMDSKGMLATIRGISYPLKEEYAQLHKLDAKKLKFDSEYKESVRKSMVDFGEKIRQQDPTYFCRKAIESIGNLDQLKFVLISDCRRPTDLDYFRRNYDCHLIRVQCTDEVRSQRGFTFTSGIDDQETECALDSWVDWNRCLDNNGDLTKLDQQLDDIINNKY